MRMALHTLLVCCRPEQSSRYAVPRMDETIARFVEFLTMTPKEQAVYASLPRKLDHFARNLFRDRFQSMQTFGSVRTGFATILKYAYPAYPVGWNRTEFFLPTVTPISSLL